MMMLNTNKNIVEKNTFAVSSLFDGFIDFLRFHKYGTLFWVLMGVTIFYRVFMFYAVPYGMNQDELNAGYETWSLIHFGTDRWGLAWPIYFLSWGSGQNVLYSYILIPFMLLFGDSELVIRIPALLLGIALPAVVYVLTKKWYPVQVALTAMFLSAFFPDFIRASRWAVESNIVPFMVAVSLLALTVALQDVKQRWWVVVPSLIPMGLMVYAYVITIVPVGLFLIGVLIWKRHLIFSHFWKWFIAAMVFLVLITPIVLFLIKTNIRDNEPFSFEDYLPFGIPGLETSRYSQITGGSSLINVMLNNVWHLILGDFVGQTGAGPVWVFPVFIFAVGILLLRLTKEMKPFFPMNPIILWCVASFSLVLFVPLSNIRGNLLFVPFLIILSSGIYVFLTKVPLTNPKMWGKTLAVLYVVYSSIWFAGYIQHTSIDFNGDFKTALNVAVEEAHGAPIHIPKENGLQLDYMQVMWYERLTPAQIAGNPEPKEELENFRFYGASPNTKSFYVEILNTTMVDSGAIKPCGGGVNVHASDKWLVYSCD